MLVEYNSQAKHTTNSTLQSAKAVSRWQTLGADAIDHQTQIKLQTGGQKNTYWNIRRYLHSYTEAYRIDCSD